MKTEIRGFHLHTRILGDPATGRAQADRLDGLFEQRVPEMLDEILQAVLGNDPAVYVIDEVRSELRLRNPAAMDDGALSRRMGEHLAAAVLHALARGDGVVKFTGQAEYVGRFIHDLLRGKAWSGRVYAVFEELQAFPAGDAVNMVLHDNLEHLPEILRVLDRLDALDSMLDALDSPALQSLWIKGLGATPAAAPASLRPLFDAAWKLVEHLSLWQEPPPSFATLFRDYLAASPPIPDWRDPRGLASAVMDVVRFFKDRPGLLPLQEPGLLGRSLLQGEWDWLDVPWLMEGLRILLEEVTLPPPEFPVLNPGMRLTPRQGDLFQDLAEALAKTSIRLHASELGRPETALRMYTALVSHSPKWAGDTLAPALIQQWLQALVTVLRTGAGPGEMPFTPSGPLRDETPSGRPVAHRFLAMVKEAAPTLESRITSASRLSRPEGVKTGAAGLFLLIRALLDSRLMSLAAALEYPAKGAEGALLAGLALRWAGLDGEPGLQDEGVRLFSGPSRPAGFPELKRVWASVPEARHAHFQRALLEMLGSHRLLRSEALHLHRLDPDADSSLLVLGDASGQLWPLGTTAGGDPSPVVEEWIESWLTSTGCKEATLDVVAGLPSDDSRAAAHLSSRHNLAGMMESMAAGALSLPEADLTLLLTANALLRLWARWLRRFSESSASCLLGNFIRRGGEVRRDSRGLTVRLEPRPLDVVLDMVGYTADLERVPWLDHSEIRIVS